MVMMSPREIGDVSSSHGAAFDIDLQRAQRP
jgi:hypothetical protein